MTASSPASLLRRGLLEAVQDLAGVHEQGRREADNLACRDRACRDRACRDRACRDRRRQDAAGVWCPGAVRAGARRRAAGTSLVARTFGWRGGGEPAGPEQHRPERQVEGAVPVAQDGRRRGRRLCACGFGTWLLLVQRRLRAPWVGGVSCGSVVGIPGGCLAAWRAGSRRLRPCCWPLGAAAALLRRLARGPQALAPVAISTNRSPRIRAGYRPASRRADLTSRPIRSSAISGSIRLLPAGSVSVTWIRCRT